jgi:hypothetical protein
MAEKDASEDLADKTFIIIIVGVVLFVGSAFIFVI